METKPASRPVVMVVDDDDGVQAAFRLALEDHYEVISVFDGEAALRTVSERRVDLVLLDLLMPGLNGWEVFERLLDRTGRRPKVIFATGVDSSAAPVAALKLGAEGWIVKPFEESALLMQLGALLPTARRLRIQGGDLGLRATLAVVAWARCGVLVEYPAQDSALSDGSEVEVLDATGAATERGLTAVLGQPPINLTTLSSPTAAALRHVSDQYPVVNVARLARAVGLSADYLLQRFKWDLGLTPRDYIARVRVEVVKQRLRQPGCPSLDRLAEEVGLCDAPHLAKLFMRYELKSPGHYRGNIQGHP